MSELCCKLQIPASNTVQGDSETRTVLQCDMVQNMYAIQDDIILQPESNSVSFTHVSNAYLCCKSQIPASTSVGGASEQEQY